MDNIQGKITELAHLMEEFGLEQARTAADSVVIEFSRHSPVNNAVPMMMASGATTQTTPADRPKPTARAAVKPAAVTGTPVSSPMMGIYYSSPSPGQPAFVEEGDTVTAGQVVGLIEAMKVFNEITATAAGKVTKLVAESGQLVQPGDPLLYIG